MTSSPHTLYVARRDSYAAFLTAIDAEADVAWNKATGHYPDADTLRAVLDEAFAKTREMFNVIDVEDTGPRKEAMALVTEVAKLRKAKDEEGQAWVEYKKAREDYVDAARQYLRETLPGN
ncbi:hypothetical protein B7P34_06645 [Streptosporangium nondiastaticum]|uniref:Uncharacterized protein n=1 Tax=Streptosporangium nondiastaticum TaxID=35764 RepID=A0A9X7PIX0_9ACTN|nr:hypothetical protein [Streptosporangium nondiastaticum]PSJ29542.1 hypothetical protein B7P34_06645 [Streptosporangium nondiastaticum]